jgi:hypothetical protein
VQAVAFCEARCLNWTSCLSFDIDVKKGVCYLSATRSKPTHNDANAALWTRISDFNQLKKVCLKAVEEIFAFIRWRKTC